MKKLLLILLILHKASFVIAQTGYTCQDAIPLTQLNNACSDSAQYANTAPMQNGQTWFKFTVDSNAVYISINGNGAGGTLNSPQLTLLARSCNGNTVAGTSTTIGNVTTFYCDSLIKGVQYFLVVSGANKQTGSFKLCINNFRSDIIYNYCDNAVYLCNTADYYRKYTGTVTRSTDDRDAILYSGACKTSYVENLIWFKWKASNNGTLVFTITPDNLKDYSTFVLLDLGTTNSCASANSGNVIRCEAFPGTYFCYNNSNNPNDITGLDFNETDITESNDCGQGQNGLLKYITMTQGHIYALGANVGLTNTQGRPFLNFTLSFKDKNGNTGTGQFAPLEPEITYTAVHSGCTSDRTYTFSCPIPNFHVLNWDFGGGTLVNADASSNYTVRYDTPGLKTVKLYATDDQGCTASKTVNFNITNALPIAAPAIHVNKPKFCIGDTILLSTVQQPGLSYKWIGPNQFTASSASVSLPVTDTTQAGKYTLTAYQGVCGSEAASLNIASFLKRPTAAFSTNPALPSTQQGPATLTLINQSANADSYLWDFGDGSTSTVVSPVHQFKQGTYKITLTAYQSSACSNSVTKGTFTVRNITSTFIPNTFTPNGDGINDYLDIVMVNVSSSHLQLFNRYGQQVFETYNNAKNWNGIYNSKPLPVGVYYYILNLIGTDGTASKRSGSVTIIR